MSTSRILLLALAFLAERASGAVQQQSAVVPCCVTGTTTAGGETNTFCRLLADDICASQADTRAIDGAPTALCEAESADFDANGALLASDADGDGVSDLCDCAPLVANADQRDLDGDGVCDAADNCVSTPNADQADADNDGVGDVCDTCVFDNTPLVRTDASGPVARSTCCGTLDVVDVGVDSALAPNSTEVLVRFESPAADKRVCVTLSDDARTCGFQFVSVRNGAGEAACVSQYEQCLLDRQRENEEPLEQTVRQCWVALGECEGELAARDTWCSELGEPLILDYTRPSREPIESGLGVPFKISLWADVHCVCCGDKVLQFPEECDPAMPADAATCTDRCELARTVRCSLIALGNFTQPENFPVLLGDPNVNLYQRLCLGRTSTGSRALDRVLARLNDGLLFGDTAALIESDELTLSYYDPRIEEPPCPGNCPVCGDGVIRAPLEQCEPSLSANCDPEFCLPLCLVRPAGTPCDDGLECTTNDVCVEGGGCAGTPDNCPREEEKPVPCTHQPANELPFAPVPLAADALAGAAQQCCGSLVLDDASLPAGETWQAIAPTNFIAGLECRMCVDVVVLDQQVGSQNDISVVFGDDSGAIIDGGSLLAGSRFCGEPSEAALFRFTGSSNDLLNMKAHFQCECEDVETGAPTPAPTTTSTTTTAASTPVPTPPSGKMPFGAANCSAVCERPEVADCECDERPQRKLVVRFDELAAGLQDGELNDALAEYGIAFASMSPKEVRNPPMVFNSALPSGNAFVLGTPNEACADEQGEGWGHGGRPGRKGENCGAQRQCLILSEDCNADDPTPAQKGGHLLIEFCGPAYVHSLALVSAVRGTSIEFYDEFGNRCPHAYEVPYWGKNAKHVVNDRNGDRAVDAGDTLATSGASLYGTHEFPADEEAWTLAHCHGEPVSRVVVHLEGATCIDDIQYSLPTLGRSECMHACPNECCFETPVPVCNATYDACLEQNARNASSPIGRAERDCEAQREHQLKLCDMFNMPTCCGRNSREVGAMAEVLPRGVCENLGRPIDVAPLAECGDVVLGACCRAESGFCDDAMRDIDCAGENDLGFPRHYCRDRAVDQCRRGQCCSIEDFTPITPAPTDFRP